MQEEYTGTLLKDGHISIPKEIIAKLKIDRGSRLRVIVAGLLSDLTAKEQRRFDESIERRSLFEQRKVEI